MAVFLLLAGSFLHISAQQQDTTHQEVFASSLFVSDEPLYLSLTMDIKAVLRDVGDNSSYHEARLNYISDSGENISIPVGIKPRGNFRKDPNNCDFPPLRLNFSKTGIENTLFENQNKLKIVTHCRSRRALFEQNVLKEFLAYRLYNLFTEESFRVRLLKITYVDSKGKLDEIEKVGFLIEPEKQMSARNHSEVMEVSTVHQERTDRHKITMLSVFQYMIGNTDWSTRSDEGPHNVVLIRSHPGATPVAVPYDFDWSGLVNAPYAEPSPQLQIDNVTTRLFRGFCRTEEEFNMVFEEFRKREVDIYKTCRDIPFMENKQLIAAEKYIEGFFETLNDPRAIEREFYNNCRTVQ